MIDLVYVLLVAVAFAVLIVKNRVKGERAVASSLGIGKKLLPYILAIVILASIVDVCVPETYIAEVLGKSHSFYALALAAVCGAIFEGPTVIAFIIGANLLLKGASEGVVATFISSFSMVGVIALPLEVRELGKRFAITRLIATVAISIGIGYVVGLVVNR